MPVIGPQISNFKYQVHSIEKPTIHCSTSRVTERLPARAFRLAHTYSTISLSIIHGVILRLRLLLEQFPLPIHTHEIELPYLFDQLWRAGCAVLCLSKGRQKLQAGNWWGTHRPDFECLQLLSNQFGGIVVGEDLVPKPLDMVDICLVKFVQVTEGMRLCSV